MKIAEEKPRKKFKGRDFGRNRYRTRWQQWYKWCLRAGIDVENGVVKVS